MSVIAEGSAELLPLLLVGAPLRASAAGSTTARWHPPGPVLGVVPKIHLPNYREFYEQRQFASGDGDRGRRDRASPAQTRPVRHRPAVRRGDVAGLRRARRDLRGRLGAGPAQRPTRRWPARRCWRTCRPATSPSARPTTARPARAGRSRRAASPPTSTPPPGRASRPPTSPGTARRSIFENGDAAGRGRALPDGRADRRSPTSTWTCCAQERMRQGTLRRQPPATTATARRASARVAVRARPAGRRPRPAARTVERFPFVPGRPGAARAATATRPTTSRSHGLVQRLRATGIEQGGDRRLRRPRLHPRADRRAPGRWTCSACRAPTSWPTPCPASPPATAPRRNAWRLMEALGVTAREIDIRPAARQMLARPRPPVRARRGGLRRHLRERAGRAAHRLPVPARQPPRRHRARHRRPVRAGAGLVHLRRRRPDVALQRQRRRAEDADPAPDPLGHRARRSSPTRSTRSCCRSSSTEISPELIPVKDGRGAAEHREPRSARTSCRTSTCSTRCASASARRRSPSWPCTPGATRARATGRRASRRSGAARTTCATIRQWLDVFLQRFFGFSQFKRSAMPNGPKVGAGGSLSPRGDWRAPSDGNARLAGRARAERAEGVRGAGENPVPYANVII